MARSAGIQIGELSRRTRCNIETIRCYERITLLPTPARSAGRYRVYDSADIRRLTFIRRARELGFTLDEVRALLAPSANDGQGACAEVRDLAARHLAEVGRKSPTSRRRLASQHCREAREIDAAAGEETRTADAYPATLDARQEHLFRGTHRMTPHRGKPRRDRKAALTTACVSGCSDEASATAAIARSSGSETSSVSI